MSAVDFWEEHKPAILKGLSLVVIIPLLIPVGIVLFTILSFITSVALFLAVVAMLAGVAVMVWSLLDDHFNPAARDDPDRERTIIIESRAWRENRDK